MLIRNGAETDGQRALRLGGSPWVETAPAALRELARARRWLHYRRGLAAEMLADYERAHGLEPDRSPRMMAAASVLLNAALPWGSGFLAITPPRLFPSLTCQLWYRCDLAPTQAQLLGNLNPAPNLVIRGFLTQRFGLRVEIDSIGTGALGSTTLKISFDNGATFPITGYVTTATITQLVENGHDTGIWLSCSAGPYSVGNIWVSRIASLGNQSGQSGDRDLVNQSDNIGTMFDYTANTAAIRGRASMQSDAARNTFFSSGWVPPDPAVTPSLVLYVANAVAFVNTGRLWGTGTVNQFCVRQANPTPTLAQAGAVAVNSTTLMTIGTWFSNEAFFSGAASRLKIGAAASLTAGTCSSGVPNSGVTLGARANTGALGSTVAFSDFTHLTGGDGTATELRWYRGYATLTYGVAT